MGETRWYVLHAYSGYENKVSESIVEQASKLGISELIEEVSVPTQNVVEVKRGVRINTERKIMFPSGLDRFCIFSLRIYMRNQLSIK